MVQTNGMFRYAISATRYTYEFLTRAVPLLDANMT
jgi:hypothetical protein